MDKNWTIPGIQPRTPEASWCYRCLRRDTCQDKENVYMEQRVLDTLRYTEVTAKCLGYMQDTRVKEKPPESIFDKFLQERWK